MADTRDFMSYFSQWAPQYDDTVNNPEGIFAEVFAGYDSILNEVVQRLQVPGAVVDLGSGTGNLALRCFWAGVSTICVEPNPEMRALARQKLPPQSRILNGNFLDIPLPDKSVDAVTSCWAFHHLTDEEKVDAAREIDRVVKSQGKIVMVDTVYESEQARNQLWQKLSETGRQVWVEELQAEYYTTLDVLNSVFMGVGRKPQFKRMNPWVWLWEA